MPSDLRWAATYNATLQQHVCSYKKKNKHQRIRFFSYGLLFFLPIYTVITLFCLHVYLFLSFIPSVSAAEMASTLYNPTNVRNGRREREKEKKILMEMDAFERFVGINTAHIYLSTNSLLSGSHRLVLNIFIFTDVYGARRRRVQMSPSVNEKLHGSSSRVERRRDPCGENEQHPQRNGRVSLRRDRHVPHNVVY